jgi:disulfide bond formation protein DsbB
MEKGNKSDCPMCRIIRIYLMIGVPIVILMMLGQEAEALQGVLLTNIFAVIIGVAFVALVAWKAYDEFWRR